MFLAYVKEYLKYLTTVVFFIVLGWVYTNYSCRAVRTNQMEPQLHEDQYPIIYKNYRFPDQIKRGDILCYEWVNKENERGTYFGRVIGKPGDRVAIRDKKVIVNGEAIGEPYAKDLQDMEDMVEIIVPQDHYFLLNDNRSKYSSSDDSRTLGPIPVAVVVGKVKV